MSGRTIGAGLGFLVGSLFGAPQLGMFIGSTLGGWVDPDTIEGNKVGNVPQQRSAPGSPQPVVLGTSLVDKCLIMAQGPDMIVTETESVGKGSGQEVENEVLYRHYTIRVCRSSAAEDNQVEAIVAVYEDGKLVYDVRPNARIGAADSAKWKANVVFYYGGAAQLTDPTEESYIGVGNVSAHRQICRMVFNKKNLTEHGNRIPSYEAVVSRCGVVGGAAPEEYRFLGTGQIGAGTRASVRPLSYSGVWQGTADTDITGVNTTSTRSPVRYGDKIFTAIYQGGTTVNLRTAPIADLATWSNGPMAPSGATPASLFVSGERLFYWDSTDKIHYLNAPTDAAFTVGPTFTGGFTSNLINSLAGNGTQVVAANGYGTLWGSANNGPAFTKGIELFRYGGVSRFYTATGAMDCNGSRFIVGGKDDATGGAYFTDDIGATATRCTFTVPVPGQTPNQVKYCGGNHWLIAFSSTTATTSGLYHSSNNGTSFAPVTLPRNIYFTQQWHKSIAVDGISGRVVIAGKELGTNTPYYYRTDDFITWVEISRTGTAVTGIAEVYPLSSVPVYAGTELPDAHGYYIDPITGATSGPSLGAADMCGTTLAEVVTWLCRRGGLDAAEIDVSELAAVPVRGITFQSTQSCKAELEPLRLAHFFDPSDLDGKLRFRRRGAAAVDMVINPDHLIPTDAEDDETTIIGQAVEYPKRHHLEFLSQDLDYLRTTVTEERTSLDPTVVGEEQVSINEVFTGSEAQDICAIQLKQAWMAKEGFRRFGLPVEYIQLVGASLVELESRRGRVDGLRIDLNEVWLDPVPFDRASTYSANTVTPAVTAPTGPASGIRGPSITALMNMPVFRDSDDKPGITWGARGYPNTAWKGARLQVQRGTQWVTLGEITQPCGIGTLLSALPAHAGTADDVNTLHVAMPENMDVATFDGLLAEGNPLAVAYADGTVEVLQVQTPLEVAVGEYEGTTLIRGRLDTVRGAHLTGAKVVVLDNRLGFAELAPEDVGQTLNFRVVSLGTDPDLAPIQSLDLTTLHSLREWQPEHVSWEREASNDLLIQWVGRARLGTSRTPVHSRYFGGYLVTVKDGATSHSWETQEQALRISAADQTAIYGGVAFTPSQVTVVAISDVQQASVGDPIVFPAGLAGWVALQAGWTEVGGNAHYDPTVSGEAIGYLYRNDPQPFELGSGKVFRAETFVVADAGLSVGASACFYLQDTTYRGATLGNVEHPLSKITAYPTANGNKCAPGLVAITAGGNGVTFTNFAYAIT